MVDIAACMGARVLAPRKQFETYPAVCLQRAGPKGPNGGGGGNFTAR